MGSGRRRLGQLALLGVRGRVMAAEARVSRWYFGGLASCGAACCTHPLDLLKVRAARGRAGAGAGSGARGDPALRPPRPPSRAPSD